MLAEVLPVPPTALCWPATRVHGEAYEQTQAMERALHDDEGLRPLLPYFYSLYADEAALYFGDDVLKSREGCQQGCSLGTLLYVLSILPVILKLMEEFPDCMILGSSDDYYICGPPEEAAACLRRYGVLLAERDQRLKFSKSWAYSASATALSHADIVALREDLQVKLPLVASTCSARPWAMATSRTTS